MGFHEEGVLGVKGRSSPTGVPTMVANFTPPQFRQGYSKKRASAEIKLQRWVGWNPNIGGWEIFNEGFKGIAMWITSNRWERGVAR